MFRPTLSALALAAAVLFSYTEQAYAYLDPGTGSMLLQALIGAVAGAVVVIRLYWAKIKSFVSRFGHNRESSEDISSEDEKR